MTSKTNTLEIPTHVLRNPELYNLPLGQADTEVWSDGNAESDAFDNVLTGRKVILL